MTFTEFMEHLAQGFELAGAAVLAVGLVAGLVLAAVTWRRTSDGGRAYRLLRGFFGGALLLSLEILVAADLLRTVAVTPTLEGVGVLGIIVLIRTFLSFSLEIEIEGVVPWRRALTSGATVARRSMAQAGPGDDHGDPP
ncbi:DUF1622 domain-containing protein [Catenulispora subtropica]|uniref:DUF1622 domain-containing protein n=1 Tax=Catenulispora subtropica TaxID=450798 RepID=A0ABN2QY57_9ACTN